MSRVRRCLTSGTPKPVGADALGVIRDERDKAKHRGGEHIMSDVSIIGSGNMASAIGALALKGGNAVEIVGRDAAKAARSLSSPMRRFVFEFSERRPPSCPAC